MPLRRPIPARDYRGPGQDWSLTITTASWPRARHPKWHCAPSNGGSATGRLVTWKNRVERQREPFARLSASRSERRGKHISATASAGAMGRDFEHRPRMPMGRSRSTQAGTGEAEERGRPITGHPDMRPPRRTGDFRPGWLGCERSRADRLTSRYRLSGVAELGPHRGHLGAQAPSLAGFAGHRACYLLSEFTTGVNHLGDRHQSNRAAAPCSNWPVPCRPRFPRLASCRGRHSRRGCRP